MDKSILIRLEVAHPFDNYGQRYDIMRENMSKKHIYKIWKILNFCNIL